MIQKLLHPSLFRRLFFWQLLVIFLALALNFAWSVWSQVYAPGTGGIDRDMRLQVAAVASFAAMNPTPEHSTAVAREVRRLNESSTSFKASAADFAWQVWSRDGKLLSSDGLANSLAPYPPGSLNAEERYRRGDWLLMGTYSADTQLWAVVGQSKAVFSQLDRKLVMQAFVVPLVYAVVLLLALWVAAWQGLRPLQRLGEQIATRAAGSHQPLAQANQAMELRPIAQALDAYAKREADLRAQEQRFFADAAHELRTPLAVIGAQAHVLSQERTPARQAAALTQLQAGVQRAGDVLSQVLTLSRMDAAGTHPSPSDTVDLDELLRDVVAEHAPRAIACQQNLGLLVGPPITLLAHRHLLKTALDNLVDNALRYTPLGSSIDVSWGADQAEVWIAVTDDGPGIAPADQERIFQRFERGAGAELATGSGLGLSIARDAARLHGGSLVLEPSQGQNGTHTGSRFVMRMPRVQAA